MTAGECRNGPNFAREGKTFTADLFSRDHPVWVDTAVMAADKTGLRVLNNRQAREAAFDTLKAVVSGKGLNPIAFSGTSPSRRRGLRPARRRRASSGSTLCACASPPGVIRVNPTRSRRGLKP
jgi:hypothetical protein